jgi:hypothetical protein
MTEFRLTITTIMFAMVGFMQDMSWLIAAAMAWLGLGLVAIDYTRNGFEGFNPITMYAFGSGLTGLASTVGFLVADTNARDHFFIYAAEEYLSFAMLLAFVGLIMPVFGFWLGNRLKAFAPGALLPLVLGRFRERTFVTWGAALAVSLIVANRFNVLPTSLGTITDLLDMVPVMVTFALARHGALNNHRQVTLIALIIAFGETIRAVLFAFLRSEMILPLAAFCLGTLFGALSFKPLRSRLFFPIYVALAVFIAFFGVFGKERTNIRYGTPRIPDLIEAKRSYDEPAHWPFISRFTSFNQLSQVVRITEEDGFAWGETLEYLGFAFIPRFLWPGKPIIAKGGWFACRIGVGYITPEGRYSNSVNMTIPGELYYNLGWIGVIIGCIFVGIFLAALWNTTGFWRDPSNILGSMFGFYLLFVGFGLGADLQIVVTVIAIYLLFVGITYFVNVRNSNNSVIEQWFSPKERVRRNHPNP